jgi:RHS repeat-associated protein
MRAFTAWRIVRRRTVVCILALLLLAGGTPQVLGQDAATAALFTRALAAQQDRLAQSIAYQSTGAPPDDELYQTLEAPLASGANPLYPANHTFDAIPPQPVGTPPANHSFESPGYPVGVPPTNHDLQTAPTPTGTPPTNYDFATGDFTGWMTVGTVSMASDAAHGSYAQLTGIGPTLTTSPFTVDASAQTFAAQIGFLAASGTNRVEIEVLSGTDYATATEIGDFSCSSCGAWHPRSMSAAPWLGQSVKLRFASKGGTIGIDAVQTELTFPGYALSGPVSRITEPDGNAFARLDKQGALTTAAFTVDSAAQFVALKSLDQSSLGGQFFVYVHSGPDFATETKVLTITNAPETWTNHKVNTSQWQGQAIKLKVQWQYAAFGVDDLGTQSVEIPDWEVTKDAWIENGGPSGFAVSTNGDLTSQPFTIAPDAQHLTLDYKSAANSFFYVELLRGSDFSQVVDLHGGTSITGTSAWQTLKLGIQPYAGETVKLKIEHAFGRGLYDNVGRMERLLPGWTLLSTQAVVAGEDHHGSYLQAFDRSAASLRSETISTGILDQPGQQELRYYAISYDIGYRGGDLVRVTWVDAATGQRWGVFQDAANTPTGYRTRHFWLADWMGTDGTFEVQLSEVGKVYSIADNIARQALNEPFSDTVGQEIATATGAFGYQQQDLATEGPLPLDFTRYYTGHSDQVGSLGWRWTHSYDTRLVVTGMGGCAAGQSDVGVVLGSGRELFFDWICSITDPPNRYEPVDARIHETLVKNTDGTYTFTTTTSLSYLFAATGQLTSISDLNGNAIVLSYDGGGKLTTVMAPGNRSLALTYDGNNRLATVTDPVGAVVTYGYDAAGNLTTVTMPDTGVWSYSYDRHRLTSVTTPTNDPLFTNSFDEFNRVITQTDAAAETLAVAYATPSKGVTTVTDPETNTWRFYFDRYGRTTDKVDPLGRVFAARYDADGNLQQRINPDGETWTFAYDARGNTTSESDPLGNPTSYTYNPLRQPLTVTDARGNVWTNVYDSLGNLTSSTDPDNKTTTYTYDSRGNVTSATNPLNQTTSYTYDTANNRTSMTDARNQTWTWTYDAAGRMLTETDPLNRTTTNTYTILGHLRKIRDPQGHEYTFTYDLWGNLLTHTDPMGKVTSWTYDERADVVSKTDTLGKTTTYTYDANHNMTSMTDPLNRTTTWAYDDANRLIAETDARNHPTSWTYDPAGRLKTETDALNRITTYTYDDAGRLTSKTLPSGGIWTYTYDANGNLVTETNPRNYMTTYAYDKLNRLTSMTDALSGVVSFGYDAAGRRTSLTDARGKTSTFTFDPVGNMLTKTDPLSRTTSWTYDDAGRPLTQTDARNILVTYGYDNADNLTSISYPGGSISYGYDALDRRISMTDPTGTTTWGYDARSRITAVAAPQGTVSYTYDSAGQRTSMTLPGNRTIGYGYDTAGNLTALTDWQSRVIGFSYNAADQRTGITRPNGVATSYGYDPGGRLNAIVHATGGTTLQSFAYTLDANGNRTVVTTLAGTESYTLDALDRLTSGTYTNGDTVGYTYDAAGNRLTQVVNGVTTNTYTYDDAGQLTSDGVTTYSYDAAGNLSVAGGNSFTWDWKNRLTSATVSSTTASYAYDGTDVRVRETVGATTTNYVWDRASALPLLLDDGTTGYLHADGILAEITGSATLTYHLTDALGSVRGLTDLSGTVVGTVNYDAFGSVRTQTGTTSAFGFTGEQVDSETSFTFLRARYLDPALGRFLSVDTVQPNAKGTQGFNLFGYVANNPCTMTDPSGHSVPGLGACMAGAIGLVMAGVALIKSLGPAINGGRLKYPPAYYVVKANAGAWLIIMGVALLFECLTTYSGEGSDATGPSSNGPAPGTDPFGPSTPTAPLPTPPPLVPIGPPVMPSGS